jgi:hypothetical protein
MGLRCKGWLGCLLVGLLWAKAAEGARAAEREPITVMVNNSAQVSREVLAQAEVEAGRIFRSAGVDIEWVNCGGASATTDACRLVAGARRFVLHITPNGRTSSDSVFGEAFLGQDGSGKYCDVFFDRIQQARQRFGVNPARLLGAVAAHELGHLLLGSHAHSKWGIMNPLWEADSVHKVSMGAIFFTGQQASLMKARLAQAELIVARSETDK